VFTYSFLVLNCCITNARKIKICSDCAEHDITAQMKVVSLAFMREMPSCPSIAS